MGFNEKNWLYVMVRGVTLNGYWRGAWRVLVVPLTKVNAPVDGPAYGLCNVDREKAHGTCLPGR